MKYRVLNILPDFGTNTYLIFEEKSREAIYIDPAAPDQKLIDLVHNLNLKLISIINTHGHGDHIAGNDLVKKAFDVPIYIHKKDAEMLIDPKKNLSIFWGHNVVSPPADRFLGNDDEIKLGDETLKVIHTPGHTQGGICLICKDFLVSGDTLFQEGIGRTDLPGGNYEQLLKSINEHLLILPDSTVVLPGHGPETTIGDEKMLNPFL